VDLSWKFSKEFVSVLHPQYDHNKNQIFEADEIADIEQAFIEYIEPVDFLTTIKYYEKDTEKTFEELSSLSFQVDSYKTHVIDGELYFDYNLSMRYPLQKEYIFYIDVYDAGNYMKFITNPNGISFETPKGYKIVENANFHMVFFDIVDENSVVEKVYKIKPIVAEEKKEIVPQRELQQSWFIETLSNLLSQTTTKIRNYLLDIKYKEDSIAFISLMLFSLFYGIIHALGPGHGKALVSSYFLSTNRDVKKAFFISTMIGVVHTFSALILTLIVYLFLSNFLSTFIDQAEFYLTKVSAAIIIIMAAYLLYRKLPKKPKAVSKWNIHEPTCGCNSCQVDEKKADLGVILGAGMIPCPTTVLIFIFTISLGMYFTGLLSAIFMSAGMSLVIFVAAALSVKTREKSEEKFAKLSQLLSFVGIAVILLLGVMMLLV
jgi:ABC-type nickel/cobalt efflux system permease component RcnA